MQPLHLHKQHQDAGAAFRDLSGDELVGHYSDWEAERAALLDRAAVLDLSFRGRFCLTGADRQRFLNGQVTNDVNRLNVGQGCYAALITAKGKMVSDLNIYRLENELLLDFEPGLSQKVSQRLESYIIADDVQIVDVRGLYGLLSVQGPRAKEVLSSSGSFGDLPAEPWSFVVQPNPEGEIYLIHQPRLGTEGFDLFAPTPLLGSLWQQLSKAVLQTGGALAGWDAFEAARIESGIPRFGVDMDEANLPPEAGLANRAISYAKGCYIGQEIISRIRAYGQVAKSLRRLAFETSASEVAPRGAKLFKDDKEMGFLTSAVRSYRAGGVIGLGYVRRECDAVGTELTLRHAGLEERVQVVGSPWEKFA